MKNFQIEAIDGKKYWIARSIAVAGFCFKLDSKTGKFSVLANKRGPNTPDFQGYWNCPCGYLDFDETLAEACSREIWEECGLKIDPAKLSLFFVQDSPLENRQNVTHRFITILNANEINEISIGAGGEKNEVDEVKWITLTEIDNYQWAFNHGEIIKTLQDKIHEYVNV